MRKHGVLTCLESDRIAAHGSEPVPRRGGERTAAVACMVFRNNKSIIVVVVITAKFLFWHAKVVLPPHLSSAEARSLTQLW